MYQVMLVDDESIFLEYLKKVIDWGDYDCSICGTAGDGTQALKLIEQKRPDIIFMDINMSEMNGLEVCEIIRGWDFAPRIIIMTAHDEFSFAHKAIKLKVFDYLLKPFDPQELGTALKKCISDIEKDDEFKELRQFQDNSTVGIYLKSVLDGSSSRELQELLGLEDSTRFLVALVKFNTDGLVAENQLKRLLSQYVDNFHSVQSYSLGIQNGMIVIVHIVEDEQLTVQDFRRLYESIRQDSRAEECGCAALGELVQPVAELSDSFRKARAAMENSVKVSGDVVVYEEIKSFDSDNWFYTINDVNVLIQYFEAKEYDRADSILEKIFGLSENKMFSFQYAISVYHSLAVSIYSNYHKSRNANLTSYLETQASIVQDLNDCATTRQMIEVIKNYIHEIFSDCMSFKPVTKKDLLIGKIDQYLLEHCGDTSLSVSRIADDLFFESSYLRRTYKMQKGKTIMQRLEEIRIQKARELLGQHRYRHSEIAAMVGFADPFYFSKRFKLVCGQSPSEYELANEKS